MHTIHDKVAMKRRFQRLINLQVVRLTRQKKDRRSPVPPKRDKRGLRGMLRHMNRVYVKAKRRGKRHIFMQMFQGVRLPR